MATVFDVVAAMKKEMVDLAVSGRASRQRGIIVSPRLIRALQEETGGSFNGRMGVTTIEGNRRLRYSFYVLCDPSLSVFSLGTDYVFVYHPLEDYEKDILGRIPAVMAATRREINFSRPNLTIRELNPILGAVEVTQWGGSRYYYHVDFDALVAVARKALEDEKDPAHEIYACFDEYNLVFNPPEAEWLGRLEFDEHTGYLKSVEMPPEPFFWEGPLEDKLVGRLLMRPDPLRIVGITLDGFGNIREIPVAKIAEDIPNSHFAPLAINDFLPEEVFIACWMHTSAELAYLRSLPVRERWGQWGDLERVGRIEEFTRHGPQNGFVLSTDCVNTRAKERNVEVAFVPDDEKERWVQLRAEYFPVDWKGWPRTRVEESFARFAATL